MEKCQMLVRLLAGVEAGGSVKVEAMDARPSHMCLVQNA
jgi:hypothetical protein